MIERDKTRLYRRRLRELEAIAGEPVLPGEVGEWCESVEETLDRVRDAWTPVLGVHESSYKGILHNNLELGGQVERLRAGDTDYSRKLSSLTRVIHRAGRSCDPHHTSEEPFDEVGLFRDELLTWIAHARGHEKVVDRWVIEASMRDSGNSS